MTTKVSYFLSRLRLKSASYLRLQKNHDKNHEIQNTDESEEIQVHAMKSRDTLIKTPEAGNSPLSESSKAVINISDDEERVKIPRKPVFSANQNSGSWTNEMVERQIKERMQPGSSLLTP